MNKKILPRSIIAALLAISISNYMFVIDKGNVRTVEFLSIFAMGALAGLLISSFFSKGQ